MKKFRVKFVIELLLVVVVLVAGGMGIFKLINSNNSNRVIYSSKVYWDFETRVGRATDIVKATCGKSKPFTTKYNDGKVFIEGREYTFTVQERYRGDAGETIQVRFFNRSINNRGEAYSASAALYTEGKDYYLLLDRSIDVLRPDYYQVGTRVFLPVDDLNNALVDGDPLAQHATEESVAALKATPAAFFQSHVDTEYLNAQYRPIYETDLHTVVTGSDNVLKVKVEKKSSHNESVIDRECYICQVVTTIKGDVAKGEKIEVLFPTNGVSSGQSVIVAVKDQGKGTDTQRAFAFTSRGSLIDTSKEQEIREILSEP